MKLTKNTMDRVYRAKKSGIETMELRGYELIENLLVDSSGFGLDSEPALTVSQFETKLSQLLNTHGTLTAKITSEGQFQVYIGLFKKTGTNKTKKIENNTYRIETATGYKIRLHDTNVVEKRNGVYILNSGGWQTVTTKDRINKYIPSRYYIQQKDFDWYLVDSDTDTRVEFKDNMEIKV